MTRLVNFSIFYKIKKKMFQLQVLSEYLKENTALLQIVVLSFTNGWMRVLCYFSTGKC